MISEKSMALLGGWEISACYIFSAIFLALGIRILMCLLRAFEHPENKNYFSILLLIFLGKRVLSEIDPKESLVPDYWHPFILGLLEILAYPVLMATGNWEFVGAWIALKCLAQWKSWEETRIAFNRFLIGNALVLYFSFLFLAPMVRMVKA